MTELQPGCLLVANPLLPDANFERTVVLVLAHNDDGALGVVLNRPGATRLDEVLPAWEIHASAPPVVFDGGPVNTDAVICLVRPVGEHPAAPADGWSRVTADLGTLDLDLDPEDVAAPISDLRVFAGYAGWGPGQLEAELDAEAWWILDAAPDDPFSLRPEGLWSEVLRRQRGPLQLVSSFPDDPSAN